ncbi:MAG: 16S rRNA (adenine(1518)-N(6)/adenine(1519)-N(6))-dimethyltransferase RsmA [Gammaproteobacteria bacterium]|nr:16S rRNA (adenine(1518)-N(6)/adenine(1519)-N(6))-dimethyltransferase RsmA [Gammaproteobacteria bacterium]
MNEFRARKRFGQNFLTDKRVIAALVAEIAPQQSDQVVEIGPGLGALSYALLPHLAQLEVIELDRDLAAALREKSTPGLIVYEADALQFDFSSLSTKMKCLRVVGNLPYNISTPLIFHVLSFAKQLRDMHFMLQKEVVDRLVAAPGSKAYGRLSVMVQYACQVECLLAIPPTAFHPVPKVNSAFVRLIPYQKPPHFAQDFQLFSAIVKQSFGQRRKTLRNVLRETVSLADFNAAHIDPGLRAEQLSVADFVRLSNNLGDSTCGKDSVR